MDKKHIAAFSAGIGALQLSKKLLDIGEDFDLLRGLSGYGFTEPTYKKKEQKVEEPKKPEQKQYNVKDAVYKAGSDYFKKRRQIL